jgi:phage regulator Rha-like protein
MEFSEVIDLTLHITRARGRLVTDTMVVASTFGEKHEVLLTAIDDMLADPTPAVQRYALRNYDLGFRIDSSGVEQRIFQVTADGLAVLALNCGHEVAHEIYIYFLEAFELVEERSVSINRVVEQQLQ